MNTLMKIGELGCEFNMPEALESTTINGEEYCHGLPPYARISPYIVDEYPACPDNWMHGSALASSYFVPAEEGKGMWLDFNSCLNHKNDVAIVISIQGVNPVTGQKQDKMRLEQYKTKCPLHDCEFKQDRYCPKCKFKWPAQNYLSTTGTPHGQFWLDGFRSDDGKVRQYIMTAEKIRGVAKQLIGEQRVFAIGIAFFISKKEKPVKEYSPLRGIYHYSSSNIKWTSKLECSDYDVKCIGSNDLESSLDEISGGTFNACLSDTLGSSDAPITACSAPSADTPKAKNFLGHARGMKAGGSSVKIASLGSIKKEVERKTLEIGAGANINQKVYDDPKDLDYWEENPAGFIYLNYCDAEMVKKIVEAGKREDKKDGFLNGVKVGN